VHYYSAAYFFARASKRQTVIDTIPVWNTKLGSADARKRLRNRLTSAYNYITADVLIAGIRTWYLHIGGADSGGLHPKTVKICFLLMLIYSMAYLACAGYRSPLGVWPVLLACSLVAFNIIEMPAIIAVPRDNMHPFTAYVPRGSATLFVPAMLISFAAGNKFLLLLAAALLMTWHGGFAVLTFSAAAVVFLLIKPVEGLVALLRRLAGGSPRPGDFHLRLLAANVLFLIVTGLISDLTQTAVIRELLEGVMETHLIGEIPRRLSGVRFFLFTMTLLLLLQGAWRIIVARGPGARYRRCANVFLAAAVLTLALHVFWKGASTFQDSLAGQAPFFKDGCEHRVGAAAARRALSDLNPAAEDDFFYTLGDYLFRGD